MSNFSPKTIQRLAEAGWQLDRSVDISGYVNEFAVRGLDLFPSVAEFMSRYGGLGIFKPIPPDAHPPIQFPLYVPDEYDMEDSKSYGENADVELLYVGENFLQGDLYYMDREGRMYRGRDNLFSLLGLSGDDGIDALATGRPNIKDYVKPDRTQLGKRWYEYLKENGMSLEELSPELVANMDSETVDQIRKSLRPSSDH